MGYDIYLNQPRTGESYRIDSDKPAIQEFHVTFNLREIFTVVGFDIKTLDNKRAGESIFILCKALSQLGTVKTWSADGWAPTPGNGGHVLLELLRAALSHPTAYWRIYS